MLHAIVRGCPEWSSIDLLDDDVNFRSHGWSLRGHTIRVDIVYSRDCCAASWRLWSSSLTLDDRWALEYTYDGGTARCVVSEYSLDLGGTVTAVRPSSMVAIPPFPWHVAHALHPFLVKLELVAGSVPIV